MPNGAEQELADTRKIACVTGGRGRLGTPEEIASIVAWIASDESGFATGVDFLLSGGLHTS